MGQAVCMGAAVQCSFGAAPGTLVVTPEGKALTKTPMATIMDNIPMKNVMPFGMCNSTSNPAVAAATAAALGAFTPMPCVPVIAGPWAPGSPTVMIGGKPALNSDSILMCSWGGVIKINAPGQTTAMVP